MKTTILLSALFLAASHLPAQDSPITIADSGVTDELKKKGETQADEKGKKGRETAIKDASNKTTRQAQIHIAHDRSFSATGGVIQFPENYILSCVTVWGDNDTVKIINLYNKTWSVKFDDGTKIQADNDQAPQKIKIKLSDTTLKTMTMSGHYYVLLDYSPTHVTVHTDTLPDQNFDYKGAVIFHFCKNGDCGIEIPCRNAK